MKHSKTLQLAHEAAEVIHDDLRAAGYAGSACRVNARAFYPNAEYPAPWRYTRSPEGICAIYADNDAKVADWLVERHAAAILREVGQ